MNGDSPSIQIPEERETLRERLRQAGFDKVGFAAAGETPHGAHFTQWLEQGYHGDMHYLARQVEKRLMPEHILPGVRTIVVLARAYPPPTGAIDETSRNRAEISAYARGRDYHLVLEKRLRRACAMLAEAYGARGRYYVDTGPVLEKAWAECAGVGWIGKNSCAIDERLGSFFFLGVILTSLAVVPDPPARDRCGSCRRCLDACPTGALVAPRVLDARRCISYLTIEHRGAIPLELAGQMANLVFGCDICQQVCPWNQRLESRTDAELAPRQENVAPLLADLAALNSETFARRFVQSPIKRSKLEGLLRNTLIAIGNSAQADFLELLDSLADKKEIARNPLLQEALDAARKKLQNIHL